MSAKRRKPREWWIVISGDASGCIHYGPHAEIVARECARQLNTRAIHVVEFLPKKSKRGKR